MITVGKLKEMLNEYNDDFVVVLSSDGEGNNYSPLWQIDDNGMFNKRDKEYAGIRELTETLIEQGFSEEDLADKKSYNADCILLYPE